MHADSLPGLETTVHKTYEWLHEIAAEIGSDDLHEAYAALRAVLHSLRDRLPIEAAAQLAAELPTLVRGLYYEGWSPTKKPTKSHHVEMYAAIEGRLPKPARLHPKLLARAVLKVVARRVSPGEVRDLMAVLPEDLRVLWPTCGRPTS